MTSRFAIAVALIVSLGACGSEKKETTEATAPGPETTAPMAAPADGEAPATEAGETPDAAASDATATSTPTPTPSASASKASPSPTPTVAAGPPDAFKQCTICHKTTPGDNLIGPSLAGVFGAKSGHVASFKYSPAMAAADLTWNAATLDKYLADPKSVVPGTTMAFAGVKDDAKRKAIVDYLKTL